jgi:Predicted SAM-dependent RNA methyltransferase
MVSSVRIYIQAYSLLIIVTMNGLYRPRDRTIEFALYFPTRHLGPVQTITDTPLSVTKRVIVDCDSFSLPAIFPQLADWPTRGINSFACGDPIRLHSHHMRIPGWHWTLICLAW